MTPKEKAKELFDKFFNPELSNFLFGVLDHEQAKQCALIAVDEILNSPQDGYVHFARVIKYWQQVKTEIEKQ